MSEREARIETGDGAMTTFFAYPDDGGPFPVVLVYMDALGLRDELRGIGRRIADAGYYAAVPDLYYRLGDGITFDASKLGDPESGEMERMFGMIQKISDDQVMADTRAVLDEVEGDALASGGPKGCVGFCLGGRLVVRAMTTFPEEFAAGSALHPSFIVGEGEDSPHLEIGRMRGELYVGLGGADAFQPPEAFAPAKAELERHGVGHLAEVHEGADHGYMIPGAPAHHEEACERSWERTFDLLRRTLQEAAVTA
jgi:carboxymethylenebutenolidase